MPTHSSERWSSGFNLGLPSGRPGFESSSRHRNLRSLSWFGYSSTPVESLPLLTPPLTETRQYTSMFGPQYGWAVCCVVSAYDQSTLATGAEGLWWPMMVNHHSYHFTSFFNRWRPSGGSWCCSKSKLTLHNDPLGRHLQHTPNIASLDHLTDNVYNVRGQDCLNPSWPKVQQA